MDQNETSQGTPVSAKTIQIIDPRSPSENISRTPIEIRVSDKNAASTASSLVDGRNSKPLDSSPLNVPSCNLSASDDSADGTSIKYSALLRILAFRPKNSLF